MKYFLVLAVMFLCLDHVPSKHASERFSEAMAGFYMTLAKDLWAACLFDHGLQEHLTHYKECLLEPWRLQPETHLEIRTTNLCHMFDNSSTCSLKFMDAVPDCVVKNSLNHKYMMTFLKLFEATTQLLCHNATNFPVVKAFSEDEENLACNFRLSARVVDCRGRYVRDTTVGGFKNCWYWEKLQRCAQETMVELSDECNIKKFNALVDLYAIATVYNFQPHCKINFTLPSKEELKIPLTPPPRAEERKAGDRAWTMTPNYHTLLKLPIIYVVVTKLLFSA